MEWLIGPIILLEIVRPLPVKDNRQRHLGYPVATMSLLVINVIIHAVLVWQTSQDAVDPMEIFTTFGMVPDDIFEQSGMGVLSLVTGGFLHADWMHLLGNMLFLWFFGRKVEDLTGTIRFFLYYLLCLLGAGTVSVIGRHALSPSEGAIPSIGASGAISGVMAAYLFLYAGERITTWVLTSFLPVPFPIPLPVRMPAWVFIMHSVSHDLLLGLLNEELVKKYDFPPIGVDVFGHLGGLLVGLIFIYLYLLPGALLDYRRRR